MLKKLLIVSMGVVLTGCGHESADKKNASDLLADVMAPIEASKNAAKALTTTITTYPDDADLAQLKVVNGQGHGVEFWNTTNGDGQTVPGQALYTGKTDKIRVFYGADGMPTRVQNEKTGDFVLMSFTDVNAVFQIFDKDGKFVGGYKIEEKSGKYYSAKIVGRAFFAGQMTLDLVGGTNPASAVLLPDSELAYDEPKELPANTQKFIQSYIQTGAKAAISINAGKSLIKGAFLASAGGMFFGTVALGTAAPLVGTALIAAGVWNVAQGLNNIHGNALNYIKDSFSRFEKGEAPRDFLESQTKAIEQAGGLPNSSFIDKTKRLIGSIRDLSSTKFDVAGLTPAQVLRAVQTSISGVVVDTKGVIITLKGYISETGVLTADGSSKDGVNTLVIKGSVNGSFNATGSFTGYMKGTFTGLRNDLGGCQVQQQSGGKGTFIYAHNMNSSKGVSVFFYEAYSIPDQFTVSTFDGVVFGTPGLISGSGTESLNIPRDGIFVVSVNAPLTGTAWVYSLSCPI